MNALVQSVRSKFMAGTVAALVRVALLVVACVATSSVGLLDGDGLSVGRARALLAASLFGPLTGFVAVGFALRLKRDVPAAQEERAARPFEAWLPVAVIDAVSLVIGTLAYVTLSS